MPTIYNEGPTLDASPPQKTQPKQRFVRWQTIQRDLPDLPADIADDIFWSSSYRPLKPEIKQFLADRGACGVLWP